MVSREGGRKSKPENYEIDFRIERNPSINKQINSKNEPNDHPEIVIVEDHIDIIEGRISFDSHNTSLKVVDREIENKIVEVDITNPAVDISH